MRWGGRLVPRAAHTPPTRSISAACRKRSHCPLPLARPSGTALRRLHRLRWPVHASRAYRRRPTPSAISVERGHCAGAVVAPISPPGCTRVRLAATALQDRIRRVRKGTLGESGYATARDVRRECAREAMALRRRGGRYGQRATRGHQITRGACATRGGGVATWHSAAGGVTELEQRAS